MDSTKSSTSLIYEITDKPAGYRSGHTQLAEGHRAIYLVTSFDETPSVAEEII